MYSYYNVTKTQFFIYTSLIALLGLQFMVVLTYFLLKKNAKMSATTFWRFLIFIGLLILCEIVLQMRFTGKG